MVHNDDLITFIRTYKLFWITVCSLFLLNAAFYGIFIQGQRKKIVELQQTYAQKRRQALGQEGSASAIGRLAAARSELAEFRNALPKRKAFSDMVAELYQGLNRHPVSVGKITFTPERDDTLGLWRYRSKFSIQGTYPQLKKVLAEIQNMPSLFAIEDVSISKGRGTDAKPEMRLSVSIYLT